MIVLFAVLMNSINWMLCSCGSLVCVARSSVSETWDCRFSVGFGSWAVEVG